MFCEPVRSYFFVNVFGRRANWIFNQPFICEYCGNDIPDGARDAAACSRRPTVFYDGIIAHMFYFWQGGILGEF